LVIHTIRRQTQILHASGIDYNEAVAIGNLALCKAAKRFNPDKGVKFATYAYRAILNDILFAAQKTNPLVKRVTEKNRDKIPLVCSLDAPISTCPDEAKTIYLSETISDTYIRLDAVEIKEDMAELRGMVNRALRRAAGDNVTYRQALALCLRGVPQIRIGGMCGMGQPYISRLYSRFKHALMREFRIRRLIAEREEMRGC
jgi:RNA polymerase sporulation-specific sigma factor